MTARTIGWLIGTAIAVAVSLYTNPHFLAAFFLGFGMGAAGLHFGGMFNTTQTQGEAE